MPPSRDGASATPGACTAFNSWEISADAAIDPAKLPIYDISARNELTNLDIVSQVIRLLGKEPGEWIEHVADRPNHDRRYLINPAKIENSAPIDIV